MPSRLTSKWNLSAIAERYAFLNGARRPLRPSKWCRQASGSSTRSTWNISPQSRQYWKTAETSIVFPDTLVGTDSHTTMINGLGVVGWGVGGIEAEAAMLGQPVAMQMPEVIGLHLNGTLQEGVTATDLTLRITEILRKEKVVGKFVEFFGEGAASLTVADRATIGNMAPEYGATMGFFPSRREDPGVFKNDWQARSAYPACQGISQGTAALRHPAKARSTIPK